MAILQQSPWYQEIMAHGRRENQERNLLRVLEHSLGKVPESIRAKLGGLTLEQLERLFDIALDARSWGEFEANLPTQGDSPVSQN